MSATEKCLERLTTIIEQQQQLLAQLGQPQVKEKKWRNFPTKNFPN
jgi:hypothetical protein